MGDYQRRHIQKKSKTRTMPVISRQAVQDNEMIEGQASEGLLNDSQGEITAQRMIQLQRMVGNQATQRILRKHHIQRDVGAAGRDASTYVAPSIDPGVEREFLAELRRQTGTRFSLSFTKYNMAAEKVKAELEKKKAEPSLIMQLFELAVGSLAPGYMNLVLHKFRDGLKEIASVAIDKALKNSDMAVKAYLTADSLADKYITMDGDKAKAGFKQFATLFDKPLPAAAGATPEAGVPGIGGAAPTGGSGGGLPVGALIDQFKQNFSVYLQDMDGKLATLDRTALLGVWAAFDQRQVTEEYYMSQIRDLVQQHEDLAEVASDPTKKAFGGAFDFEKIVLLDAWGVKRPAVLHFNPTSILGGHKAYYEFVRWVSPEMDTTAIALGKAQTGGMVSFRADEPEPTTGIRIQGHIDDPRREGKRIVEVKAWDKTRLCEAEVEGEEAKFVRWIKKDEAAFMRAKGERQPGGILTIDKSKFKKEPPRPYGSDDV